MIKLIDIWENNKKMLIFCVITVFIIGLLAHSFQFLNFQYAHDALDGLYLLERENYHKVSLGRMFVPVYRFICGGNFSSPLYNGILSLLWIGLSAFIVINCFEIQSLLAAGLICGVMSVNHTIIALSATYIHDLDVDMFGLLLACFAAFCWKIHFKQWLIPACLSICMMLGIYQSYISVTITIVMIVIVLQSIKGEFTLNLIKKITESIIMIIFGGGIYYILLVITPNIVPITYGTGYNSVTNIFNFNLFNIIQLLKITYERWFDYFLSWNSNWMTNPFIMFINISIIILSLISIYKICKRTLSIYNKLLICLIIVLLPIGMNIISVVSSNAYHILMIYAFVFTYIFAIIITPLSKSKYIRYITYICIGIIIFASIQTANEIYLKRNLTYQATQSRMVLVLHDLLQSGYEETDEICIIGQADIYDYIEFDSINDITGVHINNIVTTDVKSIEYYFKYILGYPLNICSNEDRQHIIESEKYRNMPVYPIDGYIDNIDDIMVVKLSEV